MSNPPSTKMKTETTAERISYLKRRLAIHRRRLRYWSGNPSFSGYGPTGKKLRSLHMNLQYELAKCDAEGVAMRLADLGVNEEVIDTRRTFQVRYNNPKAAPVMIWPQGNYAE